MKQQVLNAEVAFDRWKAKMYTMLEHNVPRRPTSATLEGRLNLYLEWALETEKLVQKAKKLEQAEKELLQFHTRPIYSRPAPPPNYQRHEMIG